MLLDAVAAIVRQPGGSPLSIREGQFGVGEKTVEVFKMFCLIPVPFTSPISAVTW